MVAKGLKPGDTFVDGKRTYKVLSVYPNGNYVSEEVSKEELEEMKAKTDLEAAESANAQVETSEEEKSEAKEEKPEAKSVRSTRTTKKTGK